jgi:hypothetical protein
MNAQVVFEFGSSSDCDSKFGDLGRIEVDTVCRGGSSIPSFFCSIRKDMESEVGYGGTRMSNSFEHARRGERPKTIGNEDPFRGCNLCKVHWIS